MSFSFFFKFLKIILSGFVTGNFCDICFANQIIYIIVGGFYIKILILNISFILTILCVNPNINKIKGARKEMYLIRKPHFIGLNWEL